MGTFTSTHFRCADVRADRNELYITMRKCIIATLSLLILVAECHGASLGNGSINNTTSSYQGNIGASQLHAITSDSKNGNADNTVKTTYCCDCDLCICKVWSSWVPSSANKTSSIDCAEACYDCGSCSVVDDIPGLHC